MENLAVQALRSSPQHRPSIRRLLLFNFRHNFFFFSDLLFIFFSKGTKTFNASQCHRVNQATSNYEVNRDPQEAAQAPQQDRLAAAV
ncbi:hypothetical protein RRG08_034218 [Elysia crispata]|uniref:Uncharacterized protein n=1 Tax=Elysia crispata TaxID=231223 RepID=A0AAE1A109_9GAST|nr:hypothetical protein RRG08_034218 [Elysia crispata]